MREIEIKLRAPNLDKVAAKLETLGAPLSAPVIQEDVNFVHNDDIHWFEPFKSQEEWTYPRLRTQDGICTLTVKKPLTNEMDCIEYELHIDDSESMKTILELFGYRESVIVKKVRRICSYQQYTIVLDQVERLGNFIEIEQVVDDGDAEKIQEEMFRFAHDTFGLEKSNHTMKGYDILLHDLENPL